MCIFDMLWLCNPYMGLGFPSIISVFLPYFQFLFDYEGRDRMQFYASGSGLHA